MALTKPTKGFLKVVLLTESDTVDPNASVTLKNDRRELWKTIRRIVLELNYQCEIVELSKLDFQEQESVPKFFNAHIVIMDVTNQELRPSFMYHKGNRESMESMDDIVLIQASDVEDDNTIQDLKTTCKIKQLIVYRYDDQKGIFSDTTAQTTHGPSSTCTASSSSFANSLRSFLKTAANHIQQGLADHYIKKIESRKNKDDDTATQSEYLNNEICHNIFLEENQPSVTPKLIIRLMYAFRDLQDYRSMIELNERCESTEVIAQNIKDNMMISYLTAFARSRRNEGNDRERALETLERLCETKKTESELSNDMTCLFGRIYKDKFTESNCTDEDALQRAIKWYRQGFEDNPNVYAGINLLFLLAIKSDDFKDNYENYKIIIQLSTLLGKRGRLLKDLTDYWDVASFFELHAIKSDWMKACLGALHMYLLNPPIWYLKSTINNLQILHQARQIRDRRPNSDQVSSKLAGQDIYSFWIDFFRDGIKSASSSVEERELPAEVPILISDSYEKNGGTKYETIYIEAYLQLNFHTDNEPETLIIRILEQPKWIGQRDLVKTIELKCIRSITNDKQDNRSIFFFAFENSETFSSVELQIFFSSAGRRTAFNEKLSKYRGTTVIPEPTELDLVFERDAYGQRTSLGQGSFGKVYVAEDRKTGRKYAVKETLMPNPVHTEFLQNEIKILSTLHHKNIVSYHGTGINLEKKQPMFQVIMEYVDGGSISKLLGKFGRFSEKSIQNYTRQILDGLQYLHENRILHRDIKAGNILVNSRGEIKIVDFGTSKRLTGLNLCTEEIIGTPTHMCPSVIVVPPTGYGVEVDIWSVGCTVIEMATGKTPFHNVTNLYALMYQLASEKKSPDIPSELSDSGKDFLAKCFALTAPGPSAKDLLLHPFLKKKPDYTRESSNRVPNDCSRSSSTPESGSPHPPFLHGKSRECVDIIEPAPHVDSQVSIDHCRRSQLVNILRKPDYQEYLIKEWMILIKEKSKTELLAVDTLTVLLKGICDYLDQPNTDVLKAALNRICDRSSMDADSRIDLERSFYLFIKATNNVLSSQDNLAPHVLFALDNIIRRIAECLVGFTRTDFLPAIGGTVPSTLMNGHAGSSSIFLPLTSPICDRDSGEETSSSLEYQNLLEQNKKTMARLLELDARQTSIDTKPKSFTFLPPERASLQNSADSSPSPVSSPVKSMNGLHHISLSKGVKRPRDLLELELEHYQLLKRMTANRTHLDQYLSSSSAHEQ